MQKSLIALAVSLSLLSLHQAHGANPRGASAINDIPYGIEAVTQYRTEYNYRGFILAQDALDFQLGSQLAFNNTTYLNAAAWYGAEVGDGDFTEAGFLADLRKDFDLLTLSLSGTYRSYSNTFFESGTNIEAAAIYHFTREFDIAGRVAYDTGAEGWYSNLAAHYYFRLNDDSYINLNGGVSFVDKYYLRSGFNDFFAKVSYTYNINQMVSISPYVGTSILLDNKDLGRDSLHGGIYFAVSF
ncbi:hypothetical protein ACFSW8_05735 [Rubritalea tangerina]|uniref:YaiO family outer membrane beta-barrel protein n=2 Tax=Rubritalea tangerina TaxID=430798 RepID=A0ABW4Z991_9BACT